MKTVGTYELKTHLAKFLAYVMKGGSITITKHGQEIARMIPTTPGERYTKEEAFEKLRTMKKIPLKGISIRELIEEGRKY